MNTVLFTFLRQLRDLQVDLEDNNFLIWQQNALLFHRWSGSDYQLDDFCLTSISTASFLSEQNAVEPLLSLRSVSQFGKFLNPGTRILVEIVF